MGIGDQKHPTGHYPGKGMMDVDSRSGIKVGLVVRVDEINMKCDVKILSGGGYRYEVDLTQSMAGPRSFWGGVPEVNSFVIIGYRYIQKNLDKAVILGYLPTGNRSGLRFDPFSPTDPSTISPDEQSDFNNLFGGTIRYKRLVMNPGDVGGMSAEGSELVMGKDVTIVNRAGDMFELRDSDRTLITQAIHRVEADAGVRRYSGPARRGGIFLPEEAFQPVAVGSRVRYNDDIVTVTKLEGTSATLSNDKVVSVHNLGLVDLRTEADGYFGLEDLQGVGPGAALDDKAKFANANGEVNETFMNFTEFPAVTFSNGRRVHYVPTEPAVSINDPDEGADAFVEDRLVLSHQSDLTQEVLDDIDGFAGDLRVPYITRVFGTLIGDDLSTSEGQRQYGRILKPTIFADFQTPNAGKFALEAVNRQPTSQQDEAKTSAGAFLFKMRPPASKGENIFACAVTKEGKALINIPGSKAESYPSGTNNISAEVNMEGALKAYIGASNPDRVSAHITLAGALHLDMGRDSEGNVHSTVFKGGTKTRYEGVANENDVAREVEIQGIDAMAISGAQVTNINGAKNTQVSGMYQIGADRLNINANSGYTLNTSEINVTASGKSQLQYAQAIISTIVTGGQILTVLAGGLVTNVTAGGMVNSVIAGGITNTVQAGGFVASVQAGGITLTTQAGGAVLNAAAGALSLSAAAGAVALTAGLAMTITAGANMSLTAPNIQLGAPSTNGVLRGIPGPPGAPTLNPFTGTPMIGGSPVVFAI